jgi:RecJ-like exonuclease
MKKGFFIIFTLLILSFNGIAQKKALLETSIKIIEQQYLQKDYSNLLKSVHAIYLIDTILPDDAAYYLGYVLFRFNEPKASKKSLLRYIELTKESGKHFDTTVYLINKIDEKLEIYTLSQCDICTTLGPLSTLDECTKCTGHGQFEQKCRTCAGNGSIVCPRCLGVGYENSHDNFQTNFYPCRVCQRAGTITCTNCKGTSKEVSLCKPCGGKGEVPTPRICTHKTLQKTYPSE